MKKLFSLIAAAAVCLSLAGCGEDEKTGTGEATAEASVTTEVKADTVDAATAEADAKTAEAQTETAEAATAEAEANTVEAIRTAEADVQTEEAATSEAAPEDIAATELALAGDGETIEFTMPADVCVVKYLLAFDEASVLSSAVLQVVPVNGATLEDIEDSGIIELEDVTFVEKDGYWEAEVPAETFGEDESMLTYDVLYAQFEFMYALYESMMDVVDDYTSAYADLEEGEYWVEPYFGISYYTYDENDNEVPVLGFMIDVTTRYPADEDEYEGPEMTIAIDGETKTIVSAGYGKMEDILTYYYDTGMEEPFEFDALEITFEGETYTYAYADIEDRTTEIW